jgi:prophage tail gpP-like protein/phage tail protein X
MASITALPGDTFDVLARRAYGDDTRAPLLRAANPGIVEPIAAGTAIAVPVVPTPPPPAVANDPNEVALLIGGRRFVYWSAISITRSIDSMDTLTVAAPFNSDDPYFRAAFKPFAFNSAAVTIGGRPLFTGTMLTVTPDSQPSERTVTAACYSVPAVTGDCTPPASLADQLQWDDSTLQTIAETLAAPFGLAVVFDADTGATFDRVSIRASDRVLPFLIKLAQQRGLLVSSTERGELLFTKSAAAGRPTAGLSEGASPLVSAVPMFSPQEYYSDITGIEPVVIGLPGGQTTVRNPRLPGVIRPLTFMVDDTLNADIQAACEAKAGRMFANAISYAVTVATWRDQSGNVWAPNTTVTINAPGAMIYSDYEFLIRSVTLSRSSAGDTARLELTLPGAFDGRIPEALPWG